MIKAIIFDMGGVILKLDGLKKELINVFHPDNEEEFWQKFSVLESGLCRGETSEDEFWKKSAKEFNVDVKFEDVKSFWIDGLKELLVKDNKMLSLIKNLKKNYKIGMISNISENHLKIIIRIILEGLFL